jgi:RNA polymerase sigma-70 factor (ECF subfamily)
MAESDERRFERIYAEQFERVGAYLLARSDRDLAEEALARTFEVAWRRIADVPEEPLPWLLGVARRTLADVRRAHRRHAGLLERIAETLPREAAAEERGSCERTLAALERLTNPQLEVLLLVAWDGLSHRETATVLGCSTAAVTLRMHRARARLRAALCDANAAPEGPAGSRAVAHAASPRSHDTTTTFAEETT